MCVFFFLNGNVGCICVDIPVVSRRGIFTLYKKIVKKIDHIIASILLRVDTTDKKWEVFATLVSSLK